MVQKVSGRRTKAIVDGEIDLTPGEKLLFWRKRKGWNQTKAAKHLKVSSFKYKMMEYGKIQLSFKSSFIKPSLTPPERCYLYRRRCKKTQAEVAKELGYSREWIKQMEWGTVPCEPLLWYWEN
jgi:DNA-binding XRE family transcriptional regulator